MKHFLKRVLPAGVKLWMKERGARLLDIPYSRFGVPLSLVRHLEFQKPIVLIDVGASRGDFTSSIERYCGLRKALLIEPQPMRVEQLRERFKSAPVSIVSGAAALDNRVLEMEVLNWDYSSSLLPIRRDMSDAYGGLDINVREKIEVQTAPLDELAGSFDGPVDLLKIDVQGAEAQVIAGASDILPRVRLIWMEVSFKPLYDGSATFEQMLRLCNERGFALSHLEEGWHSSATGELLQADALFERAAIIV